MPVQSPMTHRPGLRRGRALVAGFALAITALAQAHDAAPGAAHHAGAPASPRAAEADLDAIRAVLLKTWDQPQARLAVDPIVVQGDVAIAGWQQGERGGRALLRRRADARGWSVAVCAGDGLKDAELLRDAGVPAVDAHALARRLAQAESRLDARTLARFASFDGLVRMDEHGSHPPGHAADPAVHSAVHAGQGADHDTSHRQHGNDTPGATHVEH
jgi:hypothetical protein